LSRGPAIRGARRVAAALLVAGLAWPAAAAAGAGGYPIEERLSNERTRSHWAYVLEKVPARANPNADSRVVRVLTTSTEDRSRELVLALQEMTRIEGGRTWVEVRLPMRPNGKTAWVRRNALGGYHKVIKQLVIDRSSFRAQLYRDGDRIWWGRLGVGTPDAPTPAGRFYTRERLVPREKDGIYGIFAFGTSAYSSLSDWPRGGVVGIHGTNQPSLIPGRISHGCVRVRNEKIRKLRRLMPLGTPIRVR
jgi:hypothetical protein